MYCLLYTRDWSWQFSVVYITGICKLFLPACLAAAWNRSDWEIWSFSQNYLILEEIDHPLPPLLLISFTTCFADWKTVILISISYMEIHNKSMWLHCCLGIQLPINYGTGSRLVIKGVSEHVSVLTCPGEYIHTSLAVTLPHNSLHVHPPAHFKETPSTLIPD